MYTGKRKSIVLLAVLLCLPVIVFAQRDRMNLSKKRAVALSGSICLLAVAGIRFGLQQHRSRKQLHFANTPEFILWHKELNKAI